MLTTYQASGLTVKGMEPVKNTSGLALTAGPVLGSALFSGCALLIPGEPVTPPSETPFGITVVGDGSGPGGCRLENADNLTAGTHHVEIESDTLYGTRIRILDQDGAEVRDLGARSSARVQLEAGDYLVECHVYSADFPNAKAHSTPLHVSAAD